MSVNVALLEQVMTHITDHPEQHEQNVWINECGTAACFAGWTCLLSGWAPTVLYDDQSGVMSPDTLIERGTAETAIDLLGISYDDAAALFDGWNTRKMLALMVKDLVNGEALRDTGEYRKEAGS